MIPGRIYKVGEKVVWMTCYKLSRMLVVVLNG